MNNSGLTTGAPPKTWLRKEQATSKDKETQMIFKTLGIMDLVTVIILLGAAIFPQKMLLYAGLYLLIKGLIFIAASKDIASYGDAISGAYMVMMSFGLTMPYITTAVLIYLGQKTFLTFIKIGIEAYAFYNFAKGLSSQKSADTQHHYFR